MNIIHIKSKNTVFSSVCHLFGRLSITFVMLVLLSVFLLVNAKPLEAAQFIIPPGQEQIISKFLTLTEYKQLDDENATIQIKKNKITASYPVENKQKLEVILSHPDDCEYFRTTNFCVQIIWPDDELKTQLEAKLLNHFKTADTTSIWQKIASPSGGVEKTEEEVKTEVGLLHVKEALFVVILISILFSLFSIIFLSIRYCKKVPKEIIFAVVFWFGYAFITRIFLVEPGQVNNYLFFMGDTWAQFYTKHGFTLPLFGKGVLYFFPNNYLALVRGVTVLGSISVAMLFVLVNIITKNRIVAHFAAFLLALLPLHVKLSAGDSEHVVMLFFYILGLIAWIKASENRNWYLFFLTLACSFCVIQSRPEAIHFPLSYIFFTRNIRKIPKGMWFLILLSASVFILTGIIHLEQDAFGAKLHSPTRSTPTFAVHFHMLLTNLLGSGVVERPSENPTMIKDAIFGIWSDFLFNTESWRPHYLVQWVPLVLSPFLFIGLFWNLRKLQFWALPLTIIFIRLPSWLTNNLVLKQGMEYFDSRYYMVSILFQVVLAAFGFYYLLKFLACLKTPRLVIGIILTIVLFIFVSSLPRPYQFQFTYQQESSFLHDAFKKLPENVTVTHIDPKFLGEYFLELDIRPFLSFGKISRPDVRFCRAFDKNADGSCKSPEYYLELTQCQLKKEYFHKRTLYEKDWDKLIASVERTMKTCNEYKRSHKLKLIASKQILLQDFGGNFYLEPVWVPVSLYKIVK